MDGEKVCRVRAQISSSFAFFQQKQNKSRKKEKSLASKVGISSRDFEWQGAPLSLSSFSLTCFIDPLIREWKQTIQTDAITYIRGDCKGSTNI